MGCLSKVQSYVAPVSEEEEDYQGAYEGDCSNASRLAEMEAQVGPVVSALSLLDGMATRLGDSASRHDSLAFQGAASDLWSELEGASAQAEAILSTDLEGALPWDLEASAARLDFEYVVRPIREGVAEGVRMGVYFAGDGIGRADLAVEEGSLDEFGSVTSTIETALFDASELGQLAADLPANDAVDALAGAMDASHGAAHVDWQFRALELADMDPEVLGPLAERVGLARPPVFLVAAFEGQEERVQAAWSGNPEALLGVHGDATSGEPLASDSAEAAEWLRWLVRESPVIGHGGLPWISDAVLPETGGSDVLVGISNTFLALSNSLRGPGESFLRRRRWAAGRAALLRCLEEQRELSQRSVPRFDAVVGLDGDVERFVAAVDEVVAQRVVDAEIEGPAASVGGDPELAQLQMAAARALSLVDPATTAYGDVGSSLAGNANMLVDSVSKGGKIPDLAVAGLHALEAVVNATSAEEALGKLDVAFDPADAVGATKDGLLTIENVGSMVRAGKPQGGVPGFGVAGHVLGVGLAANELLTGDCDGWSGDTDACVSAGLEMSVEAVQVFSGVNSLLIAKGTTGAFAGSAALGGTLAVAGGALAIAAAAWTLYVAAKQAQRDSEALAAVQNYKLAAEHNGKVASASAKVSRLMAQYADVADGDGFDEALRRKLHQALWDALHELLSAMRDVCHSISWAGEEVEEAFGYGWVPELDTVGTWLTPAEVLDNAKEFETLLVAFSWSVMDASVAVRVKAGALHANDEEGNGGENRVWRGIDNARQEQARGLGIGTRGRDYVKDLAEQGRTRRESNPSSRANADDFSDQFDLKWD